MPDEQDRALRGGLPHHALNLIAAVLVLVGLVICVRGAVLALGEINALYQGVGDDALATPEVPEEERSGRMMRHALDGAWGLIPLTIGSTLFGVSRALRVKDKVMGNDTPGVMRD